MQALNVVESVRPVLTVVSTPAPTGERPERAATEAEWQLAADIRAMTDEIEAVEAMVKAKKALLFESIGEYRVDLGPEGSAMVIHTAGKTSVDVKQLAIDRPDLKPVLEAYTKVGSPSSYVKVMEPTKKQRAKLVGKGA
jgi:hypothetical protein